MKKKFMLLILFATMPLFFIACGGEKKDSQHQGNQEKKIDLIDPYFDTSLPGKEGIENTIEAYNIAMRNALLDDPYLKILRKYATDKEVQRVFVDVSFDMKKGLAMRSWQKELVFENISASENEGYADTSEVWDFEFVDLKTKEVVEAKKEVTYKLKYTLEREDDYRWVVSKIREREPSMLKEIIELKPKIVP